MGWAFVGCSGSKELQNPAPAWVQGLPMEPSHYIGIASAPKASFPGRAMEVAKERALGDLARTIAVKVATTTSLNTLQMDERVSSSFRENSTSTSGADLEGYELAGTWESETEAWAFYRLNRARWAAIVAERKAAATDVAMGFYLSAREAVAAGDVLTAVDRYLRGMEALQPYWGELNTGQLPDGSTLTVDRACLDGITELVAGLRLEAGSDEVELGFQQQFRGTLTVQAFSNHLAVAQLPLHYRYDRGTLPRTGTQPTNSDGILEIPLQGFESGIDRSEVIVTMKLAEALSDGHLTGAASLLEGLALPELRVPVRLLSPAVYVEARERMFGSPMSANRLGVADALTEALHAQGWVVTDIESEADLLLDIESDTEKAGSGNGFHTAYLNARVKVIDARNGNLILQKNLDRIKGVQLDWDAAGNAAYDKAGREIKGRFLSDLVESLYR